jgi:site-specific recombinase XerD
VPTSDPHENLPALGIGGKRILHRHHALRRPGVTARAVLAQRFRKGSHTLVDQPVKMAGRMRPSRTWVLMRWLIGSEVMPASASPRVSVLSCARHDFGSYVLEKTGNLKLVMDSMGHTDVPTALKYQHPELHTLRHTLRHPGGNVN